MNKHGIVGELLIRRGITDSSALARAQQLQARDGGSLARALADLGLADEEVVSAAVAEGLHVEYLSSASTNVSPETTALIPAEFCRKRLVVPLDLQGNSVRIAMADPQDCSTIQDVEFRIGKRVVPVLASQTSIQALLNRLHPESTETQKIYEVLASVRPTGEVEEAREDEYEIADPSKLAKDTKLPPVVRLVNLILSDAAKEGASDIHFERREAFVQIRRRVDGLLHDVLRIPKELQDAAICRLKIISRMDIAERRKPQDGRSQLRLEGKRIDLRVSTLPTQFGEKVVIRLLDSSKAHITMEKLGFTPENLQVFQSLLSRPQGTILVTGPTGGGKSSTLYAALNWLKSPTKNVITVEDPIEYQLAGVNQVQINTKAGVTFAAGLRSILRQDPNVILIGEIRDRETAQITLEAAQTGHLLFSTLHANDAPGAITRLLDLGVEPFLIASSLVGVVAQRLVRRPCPSCAVPRAPSLEAMNKVAGSGRLPADAQWMTGQGCDECRESGYKGRLAVHEILQTNDELRELISSRASELAIRKAARIAGLRTMMEDAIAKAAQGLTTLEEVLRVVAPDEASLTTEEVQAPKSEPVEAAPVENLGGERSGGRERVLVVEDSRTIIAVVKYFLELEGFEVLAAADGQAGLEMARRERPRIVVADVHMPGMDGIAMVKALRADPLTHDIAVLMLTSESSVDSEARALAIGADDYVLKPVEPRRLAARVKALLARSHKPLAGWA